MGNIEHDTCPNCKEWAINENGICTECEWRQEYDDVNYTTNEGVKKQ